MIDNFTDPLINSNPYKLQTRVIFNLVHFYTPQQNSEACQARKQKISTIKQLSKLSTTEKLTSPIPEGGDNALSLLGSPLPVPFPPFLSFFLAPSLSFALSLISLSDLTFLDYSSVFVLFSSFCIFVFKLHYPFSVRFEPLPRFLISLQFTVTSYTHIHPFHSTFHSFFHFLIPLPAISLLPHQFRNHRLCFPLLSPKSSILPLTQGYRFPPVLPPLTVLLIPIPHSHTP